ncbi:hypothetical protein B4U80_02457, partial [Leptotrombidium deliense]
MSVDDDDFDIYGDLLDDPCSSSQESNAEESDGQRASRNLSDVLIIEQSFEKLREEKLVLSRTVNELKEIILKRDKQNCILKANISSLYKTAKAEIERKNNEI